LIVNQKNRKREMKDSRKMGLKPLFFIFPSVLHAIFQLLSRWAKDQRRDF